MHIPIKRAENLVRGCEGGRSSITLIVPLDTLDHTFVLTSLSLSSYLFVFPSLQLWYYFVLDWVSLFSRSLLTLLSWYVLKYCLLWSCCSVLVSFRHSYHKILVQHSRSFQIIRTMFSQHTPCIPFISLFNLTSFLLLNHFVEVTLNCSLTITHLKKIHQTYRRRKSFRPLAEKIRDRHVH